MKIIWKVKNSDAKLVKEFLKEKGVSRRLLVSLKQHPSSILVNGNHAKVTKSFKVGDLVTFTLPNEKPNQTIQPTDGNFKIVYEDEGLIIIDKMAKVPTLPNPQNRNETLANYLLAYFIKNNYPHLGIHPVSRLDKDTSGLIIFAKNGFMHHLMTKCQISKYYKAIVHGRLKNQSGSINFPIKRKPGSIIERMVAKDGRQAQTLYRNLKATDSHSLVDIYLKTGRTHQIRVHFSAIGYPLLGDDLYGGSVTDIKRQALHCYRLTFKHPLTGELIDLESSLPEDMNRLV